MKRKQAVKPVATPDYKSAHEIMDGMGLSVVSYQDVSVDGWWVPRDVIGVDGKTLILWRVADRTYSIDGWEAWHDGMHSGRKDSLSSALSWVQRARDVRAGKALDFLGC